MVILKVATELYIEAEYYGLQGLLAQFNEQYTPVVEVLKEFNLNRKNDRVVLSNNVRIELVSYCYRI